MPKSIIVCAATLLLVSAIRASGEPQRAPGEAQEPAAQLGDLVCSLGEDVKTETSAGHAQEIICVFRATAAETEELYVGTAYFSGTAARFAVGRSLSWIVKGPADSVVNPGGLEQVYTAQGREEAETSSRLVGKQTAAIALYAPALLKAGADDNPAKAPKIAVIDLKLKTTIA